MQWEGELAVEQRLISSCRRGQDAGVGKGRGGAERCASQRESGFGREPGDSEVCICPLSLQSLAGWTSTKAALYSSTAICNPL